MTGQEILDAFRERADDESEPYLWGNSELVAYLNAGINEAAEECRLIVDSSTAAVCSITILEADADPDYLLDTRIIEVLRVKLASQATPIAKKTRAWMDEHSPSWRESDPSTPRHWIPDWQQGYLTLWPQSDADDTAALTVLRLPLTQFSTGNLSASPEIHFRFHDYLIDYLLYRAYQKPDTETLDPQKSAVHLALWKEHKSKMFARQQRANYADMVMGPDLGTI